MVCSRMVPKGPFWVPHMLSFDQGLWTKQLSLRRAPQARLIWFASLRQPDLITLDLLLFPIIFYDRLEFPPPEPLLAAAV